MELQHTPTTQREKAERFRALHTGGPILVLPNSWDAVSARIYEEAGFPATGTTSAGVANTLGYPDGQFAPREEVLFVIRRIAASVQIPVSADIEAGYGLNALEEVVETVAGVLEAGAVGINLEDFGAGGGALVDVGLQVEKIRAVRALGAAFGVPLVINARTDAFIVPNLTRDAAFRLAVERAAAYRDAGADCIFVPFVSDGLTIANLAKEIDGPINILITPGVPPIAELEQMGVRRVSTGSGLHRAVLGAARRIVHELRDTGTYEGMMREPIPYAEVNQLFAHVAAD